MVENFYRCKCGIAIKPSIFARLAHGWVLLLLCEMCSLGWPSSCYLESDAFFVGNGTDLGARNGVVLGWSQQCLLFLKIYTLSSIEVSFSSQVINFIYFGQFETCSWLGVRGLKLKTKESIRPQSFSSVHDRDRIWVWACSILFEQKNILYLLFGSFPSSLSNEIWWQPIS